MEYDDAEREVQRGCAASWRSLRWNERLELMIAIVNVSAHNYPIGWHEYELRINAKVIANFQHKREEGLTKCLERAAEAAEKAKWMEAKAMIDALSSNV